MDEKAIRKKSSDLRVEIVQQFSQKALEGIIKLDKECFPSGWTYLNAEEYYKEALNNKKDIHIFLKSNGTIAGYVHGCTLEEVFDSLIEYDPELNKDANAYYLEMIAISPDFQGKGGARKLLLEICQEAQKKGFNKFSVHARVANNFSNKIINIFRDNNPQVRNIKNWYYGGGEPYCYVKWDYK